MAPTGETAHEIGRDGAFRAKRWLENTGRARVPWNRYDNDVVPYLTYSTLNDSPSTFSFDLGGTLLYEPFDNHAFRAEVKKYSSEGDQPTLYKEYLVKCYTATLQSGHPYHFMWITWHPFSSSKWSTLCDASTLQDAINTHRDKYLGSASPDADLCNSLSRRLWLLVLSERQEDLTLSPEMLAELRRAMTLLDQP